MESCVLLTETLWNEVSHSRGGFGLGSSKGLWAPFKSGVGHTALQCRPWELEVPRSVGEAGESTEDSAAVPEVVMHAGAAGEGNKPQPYPQDCAEWNSRRGLRLERPSCHVSWESPLTSGVVWRCPFSQLCLAEELEHRELK